MAIATNIPHHHRDLQPNEHLDIDTLRDQVLAVPYGIVYAVIGEHDHVLTSGDQLEITGGEAIRAWNAGDEVARVAITARARHLAVAA